MNTIDDDFVECLGCCKEIDPDCIYLIDADDLLNPVCDECHCPDPSDLKEISK